MSSLNLLVISGGVRTQKQSNTQAVDFLSIAVGADALPLAQGGSGGSAYFDFAARNLRSSATPANANDLINKAYFDANNTVLVSWQNAALDAVSVDPGSPSTGDRYVVLPTGTGAFASHDNAIATWNGSAWVFTVPTNGTFIDVISYTAGVYFFNGTSWVQKDFEATTASSPQAHGIKLVGRDVQRDDSLSAVNDNAGSITIRQIAYIKANGHVDLARADVASLDTFALAIVEDASIATTATGKVDIRQGALIAGFSGLTPGAKYYVKKSTAGGMDIFGNITYATGDAVYSVGRAISATQFLFDPQFEYYF